MAQAVRPACRSDHPRRTHGIAGTDTQAYTTVEADAHSRSPSFNPLTLGERLLLCLHARSVRILLPQFALVRRSDPYQAIAKYKRTTGALKSVGKFNS